MVAYLSQESECAALALATHGVVWVPSPSPLSAGVVSGVVTKADVLLNIAGCRAQGRARIAMLCDGDSIWVSEVQVSADGCLNVQAPRRMLDSRVATFALLAPGCSGEQLLWKIPCSPAFQKLTGGVRYGVVACRASEFRLRRGGMMSTFRAGARRTLHR